jgi:hypothetical protein
VVSGIDGSGKTSVINTLQEILKNKGYKSKYVWLRYNHFLTKLVLGFCKFSGFTRYEYFIDSRVVYHEFYKSKIVSLFFIWFTFIDTLIASFFKVYLSSKNYDGYIIIDRWVFDIMVDLEIDTRLSFSEHSFFYKLFTSLIPKEVDYFLINREYNIVRLQRAESLNDKNFPARYNLYDLHSENQFIIAIDNNGNFSETIKNIEENLAI